MVARMNGPFDIGGTTQVLQLSLTERPRVLLVDDDELVLERLHGLIRGAGFDVQTAADGAAALETLQHSFAPIVIADRQMPGIEAPIARRAPHVITRFGQQLRNTCAGVWSERGAEALVGPLMPVHRSADELVVAVGWRAREPAVVVQDNQHCRTCAAAGLHETPEPLVGDEIE